MQEDSKIKDALASLRSGYAEGEGIIFEAYKDFIVAIARRGTHGLPVHEPEDMVGYVMKSFLSGIRNGEFEECQDDEDARNLLAAMTRKKVKDRRRHWIRPKHTNVEDQVADDLGQVPPSKWGKEREIIRRNLEAIPRDCVDVAQMFYVEGNSCRSTARKLGIAESSVETKLGRIREWLQKQTRYLPKPFAPEEVMANLIRDGLVVEMAALREVIALVYDTLDNPVERRVLEMRSETKSFREIGRELNLSEHNVRRLYHRTIQRLRKLLKDCHEE